MARSSLYTHIKEKHPRSASVRGKFRCLLESCDIRFDSGLDLGSHVQAVHPNDLILPRQQHQESGAQPQEDLPTTSNLELDFVALLSSVDESAGSIVPTVVHPFGKIMVVF